ncbi:MAG: hypothetical protein ACNA7W_04725 [Pseudomonadales bacterium]
MAAWSSATSAAEAEDADEVEPEDTSELIEHVVEISCRDEEDRPISWLDRTHSYLVEQLCEPAAWFDGFFGGARADEETPVGSFFRVRNSLIWDETEGFEHDLRLSANISLPRVSDRIRLLVSRGESDDEGEVRTDDDEDARLGLRFLFGDRGTTKLDLDGTVKIEGAGLNPRVRGRARHTRELSTDTQARFTQTVFWEREEGVGTTSRADWEWLPDRMSLVRLSAKATLSEDTTDLEWSTGLVGFHQLNRRTAIRGELAAFGTSRGNFEPEEYFVNFRFRRSFLRDWLFYELQPEYAWPIDQVTGQRRSDMRFYVTLEVQFENPARIRKRAQEADEDEEEPPLDHYIGS